MYSNYADATLVNYPLLDSHKTHSLRYIRVPEFSGAPSMNPNRNHLALSSCQTGEAKLAVYYWTNSNPDPSQAPLGMSFAEAKHTC
jgi:hypothetical protein